MKSQIMLPTIKAIWLETKDNETIADDPRARLHGGRLCRRKGLTTQTTTTNSHQTNIYNCLIRIDINTPLPRGQTSSRPKPTVNTISASAMSLPQSEQG